jgi:hypothetical protein
VGATPSCQIGRKLRVFDASTAPGRGSGKFGEPSPSRLHCRPMLATRPRLALFAAWALASGIGCSGQPADDGPGSTPPQPPSAAAASPEAVDSPGAAADDASAPQPAGDPKAAPLAAASPTPEPAAADPLAPLPAASREKLLAGPEDDPFAVETHYIQSNETRHDLFFPYIEGIGGAFIGVGSDQSFTMVAHAKSELLFMMDIDYRVVDLHRIYAVLVPRAESPQALVDMFLEANAESTGAVLQEAFKDEEPARLKKIMTGFRVGRETVYRHLLRVIRRERDGKAVSWLSDPEKFAHMQKLYEAGRVRVMTGNLAGASSMRTAAAAAEALGVPVRVLYMSNAEEYFKYTPDFVANIDAMPLDDKSVVLRTIYNKNWVHADLWAYQVQPLEDFRTRLQEKKNRSRNPMLFYAGEAVDRTPGPEGLSLVALEPREG